MTTKSTTAERARAAAEPGMLVLLCLAAWIVPGAGHLWMGRRQKGLVFLLALPAMFAIGLLLHGRIFPFEVSEPLVGAGGGRQRSRRWAMDACPDARGGRRDGYRGHLRVRATVS